MDPPPQPRFAASPVGPLTITNTKDALAIQLSVSGKPAQFILVLGTKPRSAGVAYVDHFTILGVLPAPIRGLSNITDMFVAKYGEPPPGSRVFIQTMQVIDGWQDLPIQTCALVPEA